MSRIFLLGGVVKSYKLRTNYKIYLKGGGNDLVFIGEVVTFYGDTCKCKYRYHNIAPGDCFTHLLISIHVRNIFYSVSSVPFLVVVFTNRILDFLSRDSNI